MARIRSVKPEFFTSETLGELSRGTRLTFIGLWTYVDDNGVGIYNEMLIAAALYPLDNPAEAVKWVREDLRSLSGESLVRLYRHSGKRYVAVTNWDEHQRPSHPRKPRYPRPDAEGCEPLTCENANPPEALRRGSRESPESLRPEQGAGSREQGVSTTSSADAPPSKITAQTITGAWVDAIRDTGTEPTKSMIGQASKIAKELIDAGNKPDRVLVAAREAGAAGFATIDRQLASMNGVRKPTGGRPDPERPGFWNATDRNAS